MISSRIIVNGLSSSSNAEIKIDVPQQHTFSCFQFIVSSLSVTQKIRKHMYQILFWNPDGQNAVDVFNAFLHMYLKDDRIRERKNFCYQLKRIQKQQINCLVYCGNDPSKIEKYCRVSLAGTCSEIHQVEINKINVRVFSEIIDGNEQFTEPCGYSMFGGDDFDFPQMEKMKNQTKRKLAKAKLNDNDKTEVTLKKHKQM